jgi:hypothetical protein
VTGVSSPKLGEARIGENGRRLRGLGLGFAAREREREGESGALGFLRGGAGIL